ncbi:MAG TPA: hypothetical protein VMW58_13190 [Anaerolineae bacterium]|nr:hypothetical protein [Anaerolineae bacterium]
MGMGDKERDGYIAMIAMQGNIITKLCDLVKQQMVKLGVLDDEADEEEAEVIVTHGGFTIH